MTHEEHHDIIEILTKESWQARTKLLEYMKTVTVEENTQNVPTVEEAPKDHSELNFGPLRGIKPDYPEYTEAPTI